MPLLPRICWPLLLSTGNIGSLLLITYRSLLLSTGDIVDLTPKYKISMVGSRGNPFAVTTIFIVIISKDQGYPL